ncbi:sulfite exporter TauE/SafE family protein [Rhodobacteraceae bacterium N5(2021)]|uniref:Probable membrane transporter protein n=1 Tax=Gymnodinialimonas phycosphaerae TaxID=2841589 RepID=A0A975YFT3_9RHOB|nr:sulfite exporter TauE/SafE family protein [Gymnodinialimonas phycosphaerae]MBY4895124.1 sulfite exporter TauE/SafE family protein [Gymnodinialimonas phycosphaerae]
MPEALALALATPGLLWVCAAACLSGLVYGFAGFGSALVFMPLAVIFLPPPLAIAAFSLSALASLFTMIPKAWPKADQRQTILMVAASLVTMPLGVALLRWTPEVTIRACVCGLTLLTLAALVAGWKVPLRGGTPLRAAVGAMSGITGGSTGLNGPPVILFNLGTDQPVEVTRANLACFLTFNALFLMPMMYIQGAIDGFAVWVGALMLLPYAAGTMIGTALFRPEAAGVYKTAAYILIALAGIMGLPIWGA